MRTRIIYGILQKIWRYLLLELEASNLWHLIQKTKSCFILICVCGELNRIYMVLCGIFELCVIILRPGNMISFFWRWVATWNWKMDIRESQSLSLVKYLPPSVLSRHIQKQTLKLPNMVTYVEWGILILSQKSKRSLHILFWSWQTSAKSTCGV